MLGAIERELIKRQPDMLMVYGDTNSTLAGALAAAKLHIPVAHVEAGLRSFNKAMPEEVNRILTDHVSEILLCPTNDAITHLEKEGITEGVHHVGDVMYDAAKTFGEIAARSSTVLLDLGLTSGAYRLATVHRAENTDDPKHLQGIFEAFGRIATEACPIILPLHPRTEGKLIQSKIASEIDGKVKVSNDHVRLVPPVSFLEMVQLESHAKMILTDSGGVQKEAYFHGKPCVTLRDETEWGETVAAGWNQIVGANTEAIVNACDQAKTGAPINEYGSGQASEEIVSKILAAIPV
jgi:UDP-GlcNAc3NAcA epimerase